VADTNIKSATENKDEKFAKAMGIEPKKEESRRKSMVVIPKASEDDLSMSSRDKKTKVKFSFMKSIDKISVRKSQVDIQRRGSKMFSKIDLDEG